MGGGLSSFAAELYADGTEMFIKSRISISNLKIFNGALVFKLLTLPSASPTWHAQTYVKFTNYNISIFSNIMRACSKVF